jgi:branched-chain amino acid transport system permease protein
MGLETVMQSLIYGVQIGVIYIIVALGLTVIFSMMNIMNFAHGEFYMLGAFSVLYLTSLKLNYFIALITAIVIVACLGVILEWLFFRRVRGDILGGTIIAIGLMWILQTSAQLIFGTEPRGMGEVFKGNVTFLNVNISTSRLLAMLICVILVIGVYLFLYNTKTGKAIQAVAQDREAAALQGININGINSLGFGLGCALAGAAGGVIALLFSLDANMGTEALVKSLSAIILGGLGSLPGVIVGGFILGIAESCGYTFWGYPAATLPFAIILLVLIFKRGGLMGETSQ